MISNKEIDKLILKYLERKATYGEVITLLDLFLKSYNKARIVADKLKKSREQQSNLTEPNGKI